jgi:hypothetical protein
MKVLQFKDNITTNDQGQYTKVKPVSNEQIHEILDCDTDDLFAFSVVAALLERIKVEMAGRL